MKTAPPRYLINTMAQYEPIWIPAPYQIVTDRGNCGYLHSLWLGLAWNILIIPYRVAREILWNLFNFRFVQTLHGVIGLPVVFIALLIKGLMGKVMAVDITVDQALHSRLLSVPESVGLLAGPYADQLVIEVSKLPDASHTAAGLDTVGTGD